MSKDADIAESDRDELVKAIRVAINAWNTIGARGPHDDVAQFIADWLVTNRVLPPGGRTLAEIAADSERMADEADARHRDAPPGRG